MKDLNMNNLFRPIWLSGAGLLLALAAIPVIHFLHWYVVSLCLSGSGFAGSVCGLLWARRNYQAVRRQIEERKAIDEQVRRHRG